MNSTHNTVLTPILSWKEANNIANDLIHKRYDFGMGLLIKLGTNTPLLISEILRFTWNDLLTNNKNVVKGIHNKKGQFIPFNKELKKEIKEVYYLYCDFNGSDITLTTPVVVRGGVHQNSTQVNRFFGKLDKMYPSLNRTIKASHLRVTFGRRIIEQYGETSEVMALLKTLFGQPSTNELKKSLGLDLLEDDLTLEAVCSKLNKSRELSIELDGTVHRGNFI